MSATSKADIENQEFWLDLLGDKDRLTMRELSKKYGVSASSITSAFQRNGITRTAVVPVVAASAAPPRAQTPQRAPSKGPRPEPRPGSKDAKILRYWQDLGVLPDTEIAKRARVPARTIGKFRELHGIPAATTGWEVARERRLQAKAAAAVTASNPVTAPVEASPALSDLPGMPAPAPEVALAPQASPVPDVAVAPMASEVPTSPASTEVRQTEPVLVAGTPPVALVDDFHAWMVTVQLGEDTQSRIVVARTFVGAAQLAENWAGVASRVVKVEALGPALA